MNHGKKKKKKKPSLTASLIESRKTTIFFFPYSTIDKYTNAVIVICMIPGHLRFITEQQCHHSCNALLFSSNNNPLTFISDDHVH